MQYPFPPIRRPSTLSDHKGFTLVELIVVITILAILGTIGFVSFQGYTADARNTKRGQDLVSIGTALSNKKSAQALPMSIYYSSGINTSSQLATANVSIAGYSQATIVPNNTQYGAGDINYIALGVKQVDFSDPNGQMYKIGWSTLDNDAYQVAATLEGDTPRALIRGTYIPRPAIDLPSAGNTTTLVPTTIPAGVSTFALSLSDSSDGTGIYIGDLVKIPGGTPVYTTISKIAPSRAFITFTVASPLASGIGIAPTAGTPWTIPAEMAGMITSSSAICGISTIPITDGGDCVPY